MTTTATQADESPVVLARPVVAQLLRGLIRGLAPHLPKPVTQAVASVVTDHLFHLVEHPDAIDQLASLNQTLGIVQASIVDRRVPGGYQPPDHGRDTSADAFLVTEEQLASDRARTEINLGADGGRVIPQDPADGGRVIEMDATDGGSVQSDEERL